MTEENLIPEAATEAKRAPLPKTVADVQAITHIPTTEATTSFANFINRHLTNADNFTGVTEEQAWTVIGVHRVWQQSDERKAEIAALKETKAAEGAEKAAAREAAKAEREAKAAEKAAEKERKALEKAAKEAAKADDDSDLESVDEVVTDDTDTDGEAVEGEGEITEGAPKKRQRRARTAGADGF